MSDMYIVDRLFKVIRERRETVTEAITEGSVQDLWKEIEEELRLLLKRQDRQDDE